LKDPDENLGAQIRIARSLGGAAKRLATARQPRRCLPTRLWLRAFATSRLVRARSTSRGASTAPLGSRSGRLRSQSRPVQSQREKEQVATIAAHNDPVIGELVARPLKKSAPKVR
jgi:chaperonin GroEL